MRKFIILFVLFFVWSCSEPTSFVSFKYENISLSEIEMEILFMSFINDHGLESSYGINSISFIWKECDFTAYFYDGLTRVEGYVTNNVSIDALERSYLQSILF